MSANESIRQTERIQNARERSIKLDSRNIYLKNSILNVNKSVNLNKDLSNEETCPTWKRLYSEYFENPTNSPKFSDGEFEQKTKFPKIKNHPLKETCISKKNHLKNVRLETTIERVNRWNAENPRKYGQYEDERFDKPYTMPPNEINFLGGLGGMVGHERSKIHIERPTPVQIIFNMRTRNNPVFTFSEDPHKTNCCVKKIEHVDANNTEHIKTFINQVCLAENKDTPPPSEYTTDDSTEVFDLDNPMAMDFQGIDYKETYRRDEQELQNKKEYIQQKRALKKIQLNRNLINQFDEEERQKKYGLPDFFNVNAEIDGLLDQIPISKYTANNPKEEISKSLINEPQLKRPAPDTVPNIPFQHNLAKLVRITEKEENVEKITDELLRRRQLMVDRFMRKKEKQRKLKRQRDTKKLTEMSDFVNNLAERDFSNFFRDDYKTLLNQFDALPSLYREKKFPHTMRELRHFHRKMNKERYQILKKEQIRKTFFNQINNIVNEIPINPNDDDDENDETLSEQSSDDEDGLEIGQRTTSKYQLRGFHHKFDNEPRGKNDLKHKSKSHRPPRYCITRKEWFQILAPENNLHIFFKNCPSSIPSKASPFDNNYSIFTSEFSLPKPIGFSPIREMIKNTPEPPKLINPKKIILKKPLYTKVKKFNLTGYLYGTSKRMRDKFNNFSQNTENKCGISMEMIKRSDKLFNEKHLKQKLYRYKRMQQLNLPIPKNTSILKDTYVENVHDDSENDWVPEKEGINNVNNLNDKQRYVSNLSLGRSNHPMYNPRIDQWSLTNMRAPKFREPTIRQHPRRRRYPSDFELSILGKSNLTNITNAICAIDEVVLQENKDIVRKIELNVPRLCQIEDNKLIHPNLEVKRTNFTDMFKARHHHTHVDHTQHKVIYVKYIPKVPHKLTISNSIYANKNNSPITNNFDDSNKHDNQIHDPNQIKKSRSEYINSGMGKMNYKKLIQLKNSEVQKKYLLIRHSNANNTNTVDGSVDALEDSIKDTDSDYLNQLRIEKESIKSCYSSNTSSVCTNFTHDSGSYLLLQDQKVPCDFITKPFVPFEEVNRNHLNAKDLIKRDEYYGPYYSIPFSGQKQEMRKISIPKDKFYTSLVRSRVGIRNRLKVSLPKFTEELIGVHNEVKYLSRLVTEWDEYYQNEIRNRASVKKFKLRSTLAQSRSALRKKFVSLYIKAYMTDLVMTQKKEIAYAESVKIFQGFCEPLFIKWEELFYRKSMRKMQELKPYFSKTDQLKKQIFELNKNKIKQNMRIVYIEDDWIRRTILQNFHYLISDIKWRKTYDWIHRTNDDNQLENYRDSIEQRDSVNIRVRDKDDAWAVKEFYDSHYLKNYHEPLIVFPNTNEFKKGIIKLKLISFMRLLQLHFSMWILANLEHGFNAFKFWSNGYVSKRTKYVKNRCGKKYFMQHRSEEIQKSGIKMIDQPLYNSYSFELFRTVTSLCDSIFIFFVPQTNRDEMIEGTTIIDKFGIVSDYVQTLLGEIDKIPFDISKKAEIDVRKRRAFAFRQASRSCALESRINFVMSEMKRNMAPPFKKLKQKGKLPRSYIPQKQKKIKKISVELTDEMKLLYEAFTDDTIKDLEFDQKDLNSLQDDCIQFYFDHFLKLHDYIPAYDFKTNIELLEGPEEKRFAYKDVLEDVFTSLKKWEKNQQKLLEYHIKKTWYLYVD